MAWLTFVLGEKGRHDLQRYMLVPRGAEKLHLSPIYFFFSLSTGREIKTIQDKAGKYKGLHIKKHFFH